MARLINKTQGFTVINNSILKDKSISLKARGLMATLLSLPDGWEFSVRGLAAILSDGRDAISAACKELESKGYLQRIQSKNSAGKWAGYDWILNDSPAEKPLTEKPLTDNPLTEKPLTEKSPQSNNHSLNKKESITNQSIIHSEDYERVNEELKELIGYAELKHDDIAKDIFEIAAETIATNSDFVKIGKQKIPKTVFESKIKKLYFGDLLRMADEIRKKEDAITSPKSYILSMLYNESSISNTYWTNRVKVDGAI